MALCLRCLPNIDSCCWQNVWCTKKREGGIFEFYFSSFKNNCSSARSYEAQVASFLHQQKIEIYKIGGMPKFAEMHRYFWDGQLEVERRLYVKELNRGMTSILKKTIPTCVTDNLQYYAMSIYSGASPNQF